MSKSPLALLSAGLVVGAAFLVPGAAHAGSVRTTFVVSTQVVDACSVTMAGRASQATPAGVSTACTSGAGSAGTVGVDGIASARGRGAPTKVTSARVKRDAGGEWMVVTVSF